MSNSRKSSRPKKVPDRYRWLEGARRDPRLNDTERMVAEAAALSADKNGRVTEAGITRALGVLGYLGGDDE